MIFERILNDIESRPSIDKEALLKKYIAIRLDKSVNSYYRDLMGSYDSLSSCDELKVMKKIVKGK